MMRSMQPSQGAAVTMASPSTNCDISNTTDNAMLQKRSTMPNHQPPMQPPSQPQRLMAQQQPQPRGPSPTMRQPPQSGFPQQVRPLNTLQELKDYTRSPCLWSKTT